jgi:hypothetical protein
MTPNGDCCPQPAEGHSANISVGETGCKNRQATVCRPQPTARHLQRIAGVQARRRVPIGLRSLRRFEQFDRVVVRVE